jgi:beta-lactam-binding protein with PASTA domain
MPSLAGLTLAGAAARAAAAGLRIVSAEDLNQPTPPDASAPAASTAATAAAATSTPTTPTPAPAAQGFSIGTVVAQTPLAGHRVVKGDPVHISLSN